MSNQIHIYIYIYNQLDEEIKSECRAAMEIMITEQCEIIEQLDSANKTHQMHTQISTVTGRKNTHFTKHNT